MPFEVLLRSPDLRMPTGSTPPNLTHSGINHPPAILPAFVTRFPSQVPTPDPGLYPEPQPGERPVPFPIAVPRRVQPLDRSAADSLVTFPVRIVRTPIPPAKIVIVTASPLHPRPPPSPCRMGGHPRPIPDQLSPASATSRHSLPAKATLSFALTHPRLELHTTGNGEPLLPHLAADLGTMLCHGLALRTVRDHQDQGVMDL